MRRVAQSDLVKAAVRRATEKFPTFRAVFEHGVIWQLERSVTIDSAEIPGMDPKVYVIETSAWRAEGIPPMRITYRERDGGIDLLTLALHE